MCVLLSCSFSLASSLLLFSFIPFPFHSYFSLIIMFAREQGPDYWQSYLLQLQCCHNGRPSFHLCCQPLISPGCLSLLPPLLQSWGTLTLAHGLLLTQHRESAAGLVCQSLVGHDATLLWAYLLHGSSSSPWSGSSPPSWWYFCLESQVPIWTPQFN